MSKNIKIPHEYLKVSLYVLNTIVDTAIISNGIAIPGIPFARTARPEKI